MLFLSKLCFLCLGNYKNLELVLTENNEEILIQKRLKYFLPEIVDTHPLIPKYVCRNCMNKLEYFYKFKKMCLRNSTYLNRYFQTLTSTGSESYKHLSVKLTDIKYQNIQQGVNSDQTMITVVNDDDLQTHQKKDNGICKKKVFKNQTQIVVELDNKEEQNIAVKEEFITLEDDTDVEFYNEYVKNIKCESISSDSDASISSIEDIVHEDKIKQNPKFQCALCSRGYMYKRSLEYHLNVHAGIKNFSCSICKKKFIEKSNLKQHEKIHMGIKNFECSICKKKFIDRSTLNHHEKIHTGIKNHECTICKKKFMDRSTLRQHEQIHTGMKNFECSVCKKKFLLKSTLNKHEKIHTGIKEYECSLCKKKFSQKINLILHENSHTGIKNYKCSKCKKKFMYKCNLTDHERIHTGIKNFECAICKKKFMHKCTLIQHENIHTNVRKFQCSVCKEKFKYKSSLFKHTKRLH